MERNRVLWVIFSICLFLVVVLAGGLYLLRPGAGRAEEVSAGQAPPVRSFDAFEYVRGRSELPALAEEPEEGEESVIVVGEREEAPPEEPKIVLDLPEESLKPGGPEAPAAKSTPARPSTAGPAARPAARPAPRPAARPAPRPAAAVQKPEPQPREVSVTEYWIQAGSYTSASRAREVASALDDQGLAPKITSRALSGQTYYRVRVGPYLSRAEAEKFLEWVKALKGFETSYISMVQARRQDP